MSYGRSMVSQPYPEHRCYLIDRTVSDFPQYVLCDDEDMTIWPLCLTSTNPGKSRSPARSYSRSCNYRNSTTRNCTVRGFEHEASLQYSGLSVFR